MPTSTAIAGGALLATNDGGHTWSLMPHDPGISGEVSFLTVNIGCVVVGPGQEHIFSTENGGKTWQEVTPKIPPEFGAIVTYVCFPVAFQNSREVLLPVVYTTENRPTYVLFSTKDGGRTRSRRIAIPIKSGNWLEYAVVGRGVVTADLSDLTLTLTLDKGCSRWRERHGASARSDRILFFLNERCMSAGALQANLARRRPWLGSNQLPGQPRFAGDTRWRALLERSDTKISN